MKGVSRERLEVPRYIERHIDRDIQNERGVGGQR